MTLHIYRPDKLKRIRRKCPYHKKLEYATMAEYYDTAHIKFDCGTEVDTGEGCYTPPEKYKKIIIFWDSEVEKYRCFARYFWIELISDESLKKVRRIAKQRLKKDGVIQERLV